MRPLVSKRAAWHDVRFSVLDIARTLRDRIHGVERESMAMGVCVTLRVTHPGGWGERPDAHGPVGRGEVAKGRAAAADREVPR